MTEIDVYAPPGGFTGTHALARAIGATYRQLDYWRRCGWVPASHVRDAARGVVDPLGDAPPGQGHAVLYDEAARDHATRFALLVRAGLPPTTAAAVLARFTRAEEPEDDDDADVEALIGAAEIILAAYDVGPDLDPPEQLTEGGRTP